MEIELKYHVDSPEVAESIFEDEKIKEMTDPNSDESIAMRAAYFDTDDRRLARELMTFRVRREGSKIVGTLKWNGQGENGLYEREEINVPVIDESKMETPDIEIFAATPMYDELKHIIGKRELSKVIEVEVVRRQARIDNGKAIFELSYDEGKVFAGGKEAPISELEIELYSGDKAELTILGDELAEKFNLEPEIRSKFKQGMELIQ
ncbi:MAG: CYTH domain-containing protein [Firmicutes bacterium]|nr:CYTH domain-containing protein [Bacillota bacterium]